MASKKTAADEVATGTAEPSTTGKAFDLQADIARLGANLERLRPITESELAKAGVVESPLAKLGGALGTAFSLAKIGAQPDAFDALSGIGKLATDSLARSEALQEALQPPAIDYAATMPYIGPHAEITALYDVRDGVGQLQASMSAGLNAMIEVQKEQARLLSGHVELFSAERQAADARQRSTTRLIWIQLTVTTVIAVVALGAQVLLH